MSHPAVREAAIIAKPDERWTERSLACVVLHEGSVAAATDLAAFLRERVAPWWVPDEFAFVEEAPETSVGKFDKKALRRLLAADQLPRRRLVTRDSMPKPRGVIAPGARAIANPKGANRGTTIRAAIERGASDEPWSARTDAAWSGR
jgi:AMP-binding enzyme C-terminal domain